MVHLHSNPLHYHVYFAMALMLALSLRAMMSPYDVLQRYGLPIGLLPKGVNSFQFFEDDGRFEAKLDAPCTAKFESQVLYNSTISGTISVGQITGLSGISAQDLFLWFPVLAIRLDDNTVGIIHFDVGVVDKSYPISLFESPPDCWPVSLESGLRWMEVEGDGEFEFDASSAKKASF